MKYIIEICVAIDLAILGIAYPIIINEINKIGERYNSNYLQEIFKVEIPQRNIDLPNWVLKFIPKYFHRISRFKFYLIITIISFSFLILNCPPLFGMNFWLINNSAELLVLILTVVLIFNFILWLDKVTLFNGKTINILQYVIEKFKENESSTDLSIYCLKTINEFAYYSIRNQDSHIQVELLDFYYDQFDLERQEWRNSIEINENDSEGIVKQKQEIKKNGVVYSPELYDLVYTINLELSRTDNVFIKGIEHQAVSGWWLLGKGYEEITVSKRTYDIIWNILKLSIDSDRVIKQYWSKAHQYFQMGLGYVNPEYVSQSMDVSNQAEIDFRKNEREKFLEFHFALGGLLFYKEKYRGLKYILSYSQSSPPRYVLLPQNMTQIFNWYEEFRNDYKYRLERIEIYYSYPDLENYGVSYQVKHWICQYLILLFIRQFTLREILTYEHHVGKPILPENVIELRNWVDSISHFEHNFESLVKNETLIDVMEFNLLLDNKEDVMREYLKALKSDLKDKIDYVEENKPLDGDKIDIFLSRTEEIINKGIEDYDSIINNYDRDVIYDKMKLTLQGIRDLMTKAAFVEGEIPHMNFDSIMAEGIKENNIRRFFPTSFISGATHKYLFSSERLNEALRTAIGITNDYFLIGFNIDYKFKDEIRTEFPDVMFMFCTQYRFKNIFFVLRAEDLPVIIKRNPQEKVIDKYNLVPTSVGSSIYASVIDLGLEDSSEIKEEWLESRNEETIQNKVQVMIWMLWLILWKKDRHIIQIGIDTRDEERGVRNNINDIFPLMDSGLSN